MGKEIKFKKSVYLDNESNNILRNVTNNSSYTTKSIKLLNAIFDNLQDGEKYSQDEVIKAINHYREFKKLSFSYIIPENEDLKEILKIGLKFTGYKHFFKD